MVDILRAPRPKVSGNFWGKLFHTWDWGYFRDNISYQKNHAGACCYCCFLFIYLFVSLQFMQWLKAYLNFCVSIFYVTCNIGISVQGSRALEGHHECLYIGSGKDGKALIPFTAFSKDDCTCLNDNISKQCSSSLLMNQISPNTMFLGISSEKHFRGSSGFLLGSCSLFRRLFWWCCSDQLRLVSLQHFCYKNWKRTGTWKARNFPFLWSWQWPHCCPACSESQEEAPSPLCH